jgi:type IV pilus assembly protein PilV
MAARDSIPTTGAPRQRGFTMLEVLITLVVITVWLLATAATQSSSAKLNKSGQFRTRAVLLAGEIAERIEANKERASDGVSYACDPCSTTTTSTACVGTTPCTATALAAFDLAEWGKRVGDTLPDATATIVWDSTVSPPVYRITIGWSERRGDRSYGDNGTTEHASYTATKSVFFDPG